MKYFSANQKYPVYLPEATYGVFRTDVGKVRKRNEDSGGIFDIGNAYLACILDGMGGMGNGDIASAVGLSEITRRFNSLRKRSPDFVHSLCKLLVKSISAKVSYEAGRGGSTLCAMYLPKDQEKGLLIHVGDSRAYMLIGDTLSILTNDHSDPRTGYLYSGLGSAEAAVIDVDRVRVPRGARVLICSDGLSNMVPFHRLQEILQKGPLERCADLLVSEALANGGVDNISLCLFDR